MSRIPLALAAALFLSVGSGSGASPALAGATEEKGSASPSGYLSEGEARAWISAMAQEHEGDTPQASGAALEPRQPVTAETVRYGNGKSGYLAQPRESDGPLPGLIVIHEWWGLNENIRAMTERLAGEGYRALAIDLYDGEVAETRDDAMRLMGAAMSDTDAATQTLRAAHAYLAETRDAPTVGVIGWCFGGSWSLAAAIDLGDELDAAVIYYGRLITDKKQLGHIQAPILGLFGRADTGIPVSSVKAFQKTMKELGKPVETMIYDHADHAFANPSGTRYLPEAAEDAWKRTTEFLQRTLKTGESEADSDAG